jgi:hypothetical protein
MKTKVIFRKFPSGEIIALFPEIAYDQYGYYCMSYMHIGQHNGASPDLLNTKLAVVHEYADLKAELERIGYNLQVCKRITQNMHRTRRNAIK